MSRLIANVESRLNHAREKFLLKQKKYQALLQRWNNLDQVLKDAMRESRDHPDCRTVLSAEFWKNLDLREWESSLDPEDSDYTETMGNLMESIMPDFERLVGEEDAEMYNREFDFGICLCKIKYGGNQSGYKGQDTWLKIEDFVGIEGESEIDYRFNNPIKLKYFMGDDYGRDPSRNADWGDWDDSYVKETVKMAMVWVQPKAK